MQDLLLGAYITADQLPITITVLWCIRSSRNRYVHGEEKYKPLGFHAADRRTACALLELPPRHTVSLKPECKWSSPPEGWCMVNVDGSLNCLTSEAGSGYVIRDHQGVFEEAGCMKHRYGDDPFISELLASREGLEAAVCRGIPKIIIKTD
jgi:hypothetical protein